MAVALELAAQLAVVVDLAIADQHDRAIGVVQRLPAAGQVDDREAPMAECHEIVMMDSLAIRAAMGECIQHPPHRAVARRIIIHDACDAAHEWGDDY
jgi:hypothetical protein